MRSNQPGQGLIRVQRLTASARAEIEALAVACKEHEPGLDLPLYLAPTRRAGGETTLIHCYDDDVLVGLANLTPGDEVEVVGMVHPAQRRKGIGRALLDAVRQACQQRGASSLTLVCEAAAPSGQAFAAAVGAAYRYAEHRMALDRAPVCRWSCRVGVGVTPLWAGGQPMIEELLRIYGANRTNPGAPACTFAETLIFNEGWLLRGVLRAWRSWRQPSRFGLTPFPAGVKVYSEAQLYTPFKARHRGDRLAEAHTHVDGIVGDFEIAGTKSGATLTPDWRYLAVFEAKMYSPLSSGTTNAPGYDQVSRTVACMIHAILAAGEMGDRIAHLVVLSPADNDKIDPGRYTSAYVAERIAARERTYLAAGQDGQPTARFTDAWCAVLPRIRIQFLTWEEVMAEIDSAMLDRFYDFCVQFNRP